MSAHPRRCEQCRFTKRMVVVHTGATRREVALWVCPQCDRERLGLANLPRLPEGDG